MGCRACNKIYSPLLFRPSQPLGKLLALHLDQASFGGSPLGRPTVLPSTSPILAWRRPRARPYFRPHTHTHNAHDTPLSSRCQATQPAVLGCRRGERTPLTCTLSIYLTHSRPLPVNGPDAIPHGLSALCGRVSNHANTSTPVGDSSHDVPHTTAIPYIRLLRRFCHFYQDKYYVVVVVFATNNVEYLRLRGYTETVKRITSAQKVQRSSLTMGHFGE